MSQTRRGVSFEQLLFVVLLAGFAYALLLDGFLRLSLDRDLRIVRDIFPAVLIALLIADVAVRGRRLPRLPMLAAVAAFTTIIIAQVFHPAEVSLTKGIQATRPHLEYVVLFIVAAIVLKDNRRLEHLLLLIACCGAINGAVGLTQSQLAPEQLASWGPGYETLVLDANANSVGRAARVFTDDAGTVRIRPPALGSDAGFGSTVGLIALPAALALILLLHGPRRYLAMACVPLIVAGIATSQIRAGVVGAVFATLVFLLLISLRRGGGQALLVLAGVAAAAAFTFSIAVKGEINTDRYQNIAPGELTSTFGSDRGGSYKFTPGYLVAYPLGAGVGTAGPGGSIGASRTVGKNAENGINFLLLEAGIPGMLAMFGMYAAALFYGLRLTRPRAPRRDTILIGALVGPIASMALLFSSGPVMIGPPFTMYFYTAAGCIAVRVAAKRPSARPLAPATISAGASALVGQPGRQARRSHAG